MVEVSSDSRRVYFTNPVYGSWDDQFYPDGVGAWMAKLDVADGGGISFDERFSLPGEAFRGRRPHQVRLQGGDASSDSYCYRLSRGGNGARRTLGHRQAVRGRARYPHDR